MRRVAQRRSSTCKHNFLEVGLLEERSRMTTKTKAPKERTTAVKAFRHTNAAVSRDRRCREQPAFATQPFKPTNTTVAAPLPCRATEYGAKTETEAPCDMPQPHRPPPDCTISCTGEARPHPSAFATSLAVRRQFSELGPCSLCANTLLAEPPLGVKSRHSSCAGRRDGLFRAGASGDSTT